MRAKLTVFVVVILGFAGAAYVFISDRGPSDIRIFRSAHRLADDAARETDGRAGETAFLNALMTRRAEPIAIQHAEVFVTPDQDLALPAHTAAVQTLPSALAPVPESSQAPSSDLHPRAETSRTSSVAVAVTDRGQEVSKPVVQREWLPEERSRGVVPLRPPVSHAAEVSPQTLQAEVVAPRHRAANELIADRWISASRDPLPPVTVTIGELLRQHGERVEPDDLFYIHSVRDTDEQGLWGIIQQGVTRSFLKGVPVADKTGEDTLWMEIPNNADERLDDNSSSFFGRLIHEKVQRTYIYNFKKNRIGRDPDIVRPGQEIVIVRFRPEELISIYRHFRERG